MALIGWDRIVEERIQDAMTAGKFDNLRGKGRPLKLDENPFEDPAWRMANHILHNNGFVWPWMEERNEMERTRAAASETLVRTWHWYCRAKAAGASPRAEARWQQAMAVFHQQAAELNGRIHRYNLVVPSPAFQRLALDADEELRHLAAVT